jgi:transketolase
MMMTQKTKTQAPAWRKLFEKIKREFPEMAAERIERILELAYENIQDTFDEARTQAEKEAKERRQRKALGSKLGPKAPGLPNRS